MPQCVGCGKTLGAGIGNRCFNCKLIPKPVSSAPRPAVVSQPSRPVYQPAPVARPVYQLAPVYQAPVAAPQTRSYSQVAPIPTPSGATCARHGCNQICNLGNNYCCRTCNELARGLTSTHATPVATGSIVRQPVVARVARVQPRDVCARPGCYQPRYSSYEYCGRTCGRLANPVPQPRTQPVCNYATPVCARPGCYQPRCSGYDYCGRTCGQLANPRQLAQTGPVCAAQGCTQLPYPGQDYCGRTCALASSAPQRMTVVVAVPARPPPNGNRSCLGCAAAFQSSGQGDDYCQLCAFGFQVRAGYNTASGCRNCGRPVYPGHPFCSRTCSKR